MQNTLEKESFLYFKEVIGSDLYSPLKDLCHMLEYLGLGLRGAQSKGDLLD